MRNEEELKTIKNERAEEEEVKKEVERHVPSLRGFSHCQI